MKNNKNRVTTELTICAVLWVLLIALKGLGISAMSWPTVLLGFLWIPGLWCILTALLGGIFIAVTCMCTGALATLGKLKRWHRRRKTDRATIALAKEWGLWDKPQYLGGRALELRAWEDFKIKRLPGETDTALRRRCGEIEIVKQKAKEHGRKIKKIKADGHNIQITLCDETPPREGGHSNEQS